MAQKQTAFIAYFYLLLYVSWDWIINNSRLVLLKHSEEEVKKGN